MKDQRKGDAEKTEPGESTKSRDEGQNFQLDDEESEAIYSLYNEGDKEQEIDPSTSKPKRVVIDKEVGPKFFYISNKSNERSNCS